MNRRLSVLGAIALASLACDDAAPAAEPGAPELKCSEIVLEVGNSAIARCPDGARFSWIVDGREVLAERTVGLVAGGVEVLGTQWPQVSWQTEPDDRAFDNALRVAFRDHPDLPDLQVDLFPDAGDVRASLRIEVRIEVQNPIALDRLVALNGGPMPTGPLLGTTGFVDQLQQPRTGSQAWLGNDAVLSVWAARPAQVAADGRIGHMIDAELASGATIGATAHWTFDSRAYAVLSDPLRGRTVAQPVGWRTGPSHGAVVDVSAIAAEMTILNAHLPSTALLVDGLWSPGLGDWQIAPGLGELSTDLGLFAPIDLSCPASPDFETASALAASNEQECIRLDPALPASRTLLQRQLADNGLDGDNVTLFADTPAFCSALGLSGIGPFPGVNCSEAESRFDRVLGAPGERCLREALSGPFPRSPDCQTELRTLADAVTVPPVDPADGMQRLMSFVDLARVSPLPLTLSGAAGRARQRLMLNVLGGARLYLADAPSSLPPEAFEWLVAAATTDFGQFSIRLAADDWPPSHWESDTSLILFNWTAAPRTVDLEPGWQNTTDLFQPEIRATDRIEIPPHDVRVLVPASE